MCSESGNTGHPQDDKLETSDYFVACKKKQFFSRKDSFLAGRVLVSSHARSKTPQIQPNTFSFKEKERSKCLVIFTTFVYSTSC